MRGAPKAEIDRRVGAIAELLQLTPLLDRKADRLSVNILQRVAIGRSAIMEPAIFLLDEPLSNVDAAFRAVMRTELKHLQRQFRQTMVYVTHDQLEAMTMADRIAVMDHGVLQQVGTPLEVYNNPANVFVARFIGSPGMNLLKGTPAESDRGLVVDLGPLGADAAAARPAGAALRGSKRRGAVTASGRSRRRSQPSGPGLAVPVTFVERIGARTIVHLGEGETRGEGRVRQRCRAGDRRDRDRRAQHRTAVRLFDARQRPRRSGRREPWPRSPSAMSRSATATRSPSTDATFTVQRQRVLLLLRPAAVGQVDDPAPDPRPGDAGQRRDPDRRQAGQRGVAGRAQRRHGVPEPGAVPAHDARATTSASRWSSARCRRPRSSSALADVAAKLHIGHILHKPPAQLSGGERQRVAIARALVRDPVAYLMDDPISALDARLREETRVELKRIQRELGKTLIYVTHDQEEAMSVADRMAILENGAHPPDRHAGRDLRPPGQRLCRAPARLADDEHPDIGARAMARSKRRDGAIRVARPAAPAASSRSACGRRTSRCAPWADGGAGRPAKVFEVEPLGGYTVVTLDAGKSRLRALMRGQPDIRPEAHGGADLRRRAASTALRRAEARSRDEQRRNKYERED